MADSKITALTALTGAGVATGDAFVLVDISDTTMDATGTDKKITADELRKAMGALGETSVDAIWDAKGDLAVGTGADTASKLTAGANGTILAADSTQTTGLKWATGRAYTVDEAHADAGSASSVAEQTLASLTLPAGAAAVGDTLRFTAMGDYLNSSGGAVTYTWRFKIGATTVLTTIAFSTSSGANRSKWAMKADIAVESTSAQRVTGDLIMGITAAGSNTWQTYIGAGAAGLAAIGYGTAAEDYTAASNHILTCQLGTSNASADVILHAANLVLVKK